MPAKLLDGGLEDALGAGPPRVRRTRDPCMLGSTTACDPDLLSDAVPPCCEVRAYACLHLRVQELMLRAASAR